MHIKIPKLSLVVLVGASGSGKSTFARRHFASTEVVSSDECRGMVCDDANDQAATGDAFELLNFVAAKRLARGKLTVVDATSTQPEARKPLVALARRFHCLPVAVVLNVPEKVCHERNAARPERAFGPHVVRNQRSQLRRSLKRLRKEGFRHVFVMDSVEQVDAATVEHVPLWNDRREERGPFDVIGDVHGCADELEALLADLGYVADAEPAAAPWGGATHRHPAGRKAVFVGDLVDRGPRTPDVVRLVRNMVVAGTALCVPGNHDVKLVRALRGKKVKVNHGLAESLEQIGPLPDELKREMADFLDGLVSHYVLDDGKLVVAHAGLREELQGRGSGRVREFCLYGETTGETDAFGLPVRHDWAADYRGSAAVVYGHTPVPAPEWLNGTVDVDTGCVFGGRLTALRWPEREFVSVPAARVHCEPRRPFLPDANAGDDDPSRTAQQAGDDVLDAADVIGKRIVATALMGNVTVRAENATAALEVMSRFAADPKWLVHLPPTMSPCDTSDLPGTLEHPEQAFAYYRGQGVGRVVCQEKHMGSRAVVVVCRDADAATERFGVVGDEAGVVVTRTGRRFFGDLETEAALLDRLRGALSAAGFWERLDTSWAVLDCELMPWSAKAQQLLRTQYAAVGAAGRAALPHAVAALEQASARLEGDAAATLDTLVQRFGRRRQSIDRFTAAYRHHCWPVTDASDLKLAPFHLLASEGHVHTGHDHLWHMETLAGICARDDVLLATDCLTVELADEASVARGVGWWESKTAAGGEGMVVKPLHWIVRGRKGLVQPAVKCRGREYLRIIYGPDYDADGNLPRLRHRGLGRKRSLALREFALGIEALERFVRREPLRRVHECVFGVLALESEPVDPRL